MRLGDQYTQVRLKAVSSSRIDTFLTKSSIFTQIPGVETMGNIEKVAVQVQEAFFVIDLFRRTLSWKAACKC
jgi:NADPH:quinone reductase-like Zn-dependent oxidoreductase